MDRDLNAHIILGYGHVNRLSRDRRLELGGLSLDSELAPPQDKTAIEKGVGILSRMYIFSNGDNHRSAKDIWLPLFSRRSIDDLTRHLMDLAKDEISKFSDRENFDVVDDIAMPFVSKSILSYLGIDDLYGQDFLHHNRNFVRILDGKIFDMNDFFQSLISVSRLHEMMSERVHSMISLGKENNILPSLFSAMAKSEPQVFENLISNLILVVTAAHDSTAHLVGNAIMMLSKHREMRDLIRKDRSLISNLVQETLRYDCPIQCVSRVANSPISIDGYNIMKGDRVMLHVGSANRDPSMFHNADEFDIFRPNNFNALSFGIGAHRCLGQYLAIREAEVMLAALMDAFPSISVDFDNVVWDVGIAARGPAKVPVRVDGSGRS